MRRVSAFKAEVAGRSVKDIAIEILEIAREGLRLRARPGSVDLDETPFLDPLQEIAESGVTMGEQVASHFMNDLNGDARALLSESEY